jgi:uncharacterized protein (TIGR00251 family)
VSRLFVHVTPKASRPGISGWREDELQVRVSVAPEGGKANAEVCAAVARAVGIPKSRVSVVRGATSRHKELELDGVTEAQLRETFGSQQSTTGGANP